MTYQSILPEHQSQGPRWPNSNQQDILRAPRKHHYHGDLAGISYGQRDPNLKLAVGLRYWDVKVRLGD